MNVLTNNHSVNMLSQNRHRRNLFGILCALALALIITSAPSANGVFKFAGAAFAATPQKNINNSGDFLTYNNASYGVNIQYPHNWSSSPGEGNDNSGDSSTDIASFSPKDSSSSASLDVLVDNIDSSENLKQYVSDSISDDKTDLKNFTVSEPIFNGVNLAGSPAYKLIYSYTDQGQNFKGLETGTIIGNKAYFIQYENSPSKFDSDLPTIQKMIDSLTLANIHNTG